MEYLLDGNEISDVSGDNTLILSYPELYEYNSIEDLFSNGIEKVIILYLQDKNGNNMNGHWVCLTKYKNIVSFFDPYSYMPDSQIKWNDKKQRLKLNQDENYLTKLLLDYANRGGIVEYNDMKFQKHDPNINTCGRHCAIRARFYEIPLKKYQNLFKEMKKKGFNLDELSVDLSNEIVGRNIE